MFKKTILTLAVIASASICQQSSAEIIESWTFKTTKDISQIKNWFPGKKVQFEKSFDANVEVNGKKGAMAVKIISADPKAGTGSLQLGFISKKPLIANGKYKISFYAKCSSKGPISVTAIMNQKPWALLGKNAKLKTDLTTEWKKYEFEFVSMFDYDEASRVPCVFLGKLPTGSVFMIQDVILEKID